VLRQFKAASVLTLFLKLFGDVSLFKYNVCFIFMLSLIKHSALWLGVQEGSHCMSSLRLSNEEQLAVHDSISSLYGWGQ